MAPNHDFQVKPRPHMSFVGGKSDAVDAECHDKALIRFRASPDAQLRVGPLHLSRADLPRPIRGRIQDDQVARVHIGQVDHLSKEIIQRVTASLIKFNEILLADFYPESHIRDSIRTGIGSLDPEVCCLPLWNHFPKSRTMCMKMELLMPATLSGNSYLVCREIKVCQRVGESLFAPVNFHRVPVV